MTKSEVMDLTKICRNFPESPTSEIYRENLLATVDDIFNSEIQVVFVEGTEGAGKTVFLSQYAKKHAHNALSLFIKPASRFTYEPEYLKIVLSEQVYWALNKKTSESDLDGSFLNSGFQKLQRLARQTNNFYFIVDGLNDIQEADIIDIILKEILPFGMSGFKFLLANNSKDISEKLSSTPNKSFILPKFSLSETKKYLEELKLEPQSVKYVHEMCRQIPGNLAILKRMLLSGISIDSLLDENLDNLPDFIRSEWEKSKISSKKSKKLLALIVYSRNEIPMGELSSLLSVSVQEIKNILQGVEFITIDSKTDVVSFISEAHRKYALKQLLEFKKEIHELLIEDLHKDTSSDSALMHLPIYYKRAGRLNDLLEYLTPEHFAQLLEHSQSLSSVHRRASMGLETAKKLSQNEMLMRFSIQKSIMNKLNWAKVWRSEIEARMKLEDYGAALALAQHAVLKEDRLHLLVIIAKIKQKKGLAPEHELMEQISTLYKQIDQKELGERAIEIASDLVCLDPDLAIQMIENTTSLSKDQDALDITFARLSLIALNANEKEEQPQQRSDAIEKTHTKIKNTKIQEFFEAISVFFENYSATEVISHVSKLDIKNRLLFLRHWAMSHSEKDDAIDVIDYSLDILIKNTPYIPKTRDIRAIATPLPSVSDQTRAKQLVGRFDGLKGSIEKLGTTEDYVRLQLLLAETESKYDITAAQDRIVETYLYTDELDDLSVKTECFAWMVSSLNKIDPSNFFEDKDQLHTLAQNELETSIKKLLSNSADHYHVAKGAIRALAKTKSQTALDLACSLNTQERREQARLELINTMLKMPLKKLDFSFMGIVLEKFSDLDFKDEAFVRITKKLYLTQETLDNSIVKNTLPLINSIQNMYDARERCIAYCFAYSFLKKQDEHTYNGLMSNLSTQLDSSWKAIDVGWEKIDMGFKIAKTLSLASPEMAQKYLDETDKNKNEVIIDAEKPAQSYILGLKLVIRAYAGLLPKRINQKDDIDRISSLIDRIPSNGERIKLWSELSLYCFTNKHSDMCKDIVTEHVKPLLSDISDDDRYYKQRIIIEISPALYCTHQVTAFELLSKLPQPQKDDAYTEICYFLLHKQLSSEPYSESHGDGFQLKYEEAVNVLEVVQKMDIDSNIYFTIEKIVDSVFSQRHKNRFTKQQKSDLAGRIERIIDAKLPDKQNIKHDGFKIAAQAQLARIQEAKQPIIWNGLLELARQIPNAADRPIVLSMIYTMLPKRDKYKRVIEEIKELIDDIPTDLDRMNRYLGLAEDMVGIEPKISRQCLESAMEFSLKTENSNQTYLRQRRIIDLAHKLEPSYAATLAKLVDDDPARIESRIALQKRLGILDTKKKMTEQARSKSQHTIQKQDYPAASWLNLGGLNANKVVTFHSDVVRDYIDIASEFSIDEAYPILSWIIENGVRRLADTKDAKLLRPMFEATLSGAELASRVAARSLAQQKKIKSYEIEVSNTNDVIIKPGERENALQYLKEWFSQKVQNYLKICDPYFGLEDLEVLQILNSVNPTCRVSILTSKKHQSNVQQPIAETFRNHWKIRISEQEAPDTEIIIVGTKSTGASPIHDRWWLTEGSGIRIGTSFNSLGIKTSEISVLSHKEAVSREKEIDQYLRREKREYNNEKLQYDSFTL